jgi:hypothetical protein
MSQASKLKSSRVLNFLLALFIVPGVVGQTPRFRGPKEFLPYTRNLPRIDKIELLELELKDDRWAGEVAASKVLKGAEAQKVASLWRRQTYTPPAMNRVMRSNFITGKDCLLMRAFAGPVTAYFS